MVSNLIDEFGPERASIEKRLRHPLTEPEWNHLVDQERIKELQDAHDRELEQRLVEEIVAEVRRLRSESVRDRVLFPGAPPADQLPRLMALAALQARNEEDSPDVRQARSAVGGLVQPSEIARCLEAASGTKRFLPTSDGNMVLAPEAIHSCVSRLAAQYHWRIEDALAFVVAGVTPVVQWASVTYGLDGPDTRITITVDPEMSPKTVAALYAASRRLIQPKQRIRSMTEKMAALARFVVHSDPRSDWRTRMARWNQAIAEDYPTWAHSEVSNFNRDAHAALRRIQEPGWGIPSPGGSLQDMGEA